MTRSCKSLNLFQQMGYNTRFINEIPTEIRQTRRLSPNIKAPDVLRMECDLISLEDLWINYAAYLQKGDSRINALKAVQSGDKVTLHHEDQPGNRSRLVIKDSKGNCLATLSKRGYAKWISKLDNIHKIVVVGVHIREREDGEGDNTGARESWSIPVFEAYSYPINVAQVNSPETHRKHAEEHL